MWDITQDVKVVDDKVDNEAINVNVSVVVWRGGCGR